MVWRGGAERTNSAFFYSDREIAWRGLHGKSEYDMDDFICFCYYTPPPLERLLVAALFSRLAENGSCLVSFR